MESRQLLAKNLKKLRVAKGLSQEGLAVEAKVERSHLGKIERKKLSPTLEVIDRLALALGVGVADLFNPSTASDKRPTKLEGGRKSAKHLRKRS